MIEGATQREVASGEQSLAVIEAGDTEAPTIVFVHGYPDTKEMWEPVLARLASRFHVVAYDVRGAGGSSRPHGPAAYDLARLTEDFTAVIDAVSPGRPVHLVGHDWGGIQGWEFAASPRLRDRLRSFTTIAGPSLEQAGAGVRRLAARGQLWAMLGRLRRSWYIVALCAPGGPTIAWRVLLAGGRWRRSLSLADGVAVDERYPGPTLPADGVAGANLYRQNIARRIFQSRPAARSSVPVQLIIPSGDRFISQSYYELAEARAPRVRRRIVPGSHWAPRSQPELVAQLIGEFALETGADPAI